MNSQDFINKWNGKVVADGQCGNLVRQYWIEVDQTTPPSYSNSKDYWSQPVPGYDKVHDPQPGDIAIYNGHGAYTEGHSAIYVDGRVFEQNADPDGSPAHLFNRANTYLLGYLRKQGEEDMEQKLNRGDLVNLFRQLIGRDPNDNDYEFHLNRPDASWNRTVYDLLSRPDCLLKADANYVEDCAVGTLGRSSVGDKNLQNNVGSLVRDCLRNFVNYPEAKAFRAVATGSGTVNKDTVIKYINNNLK